MHYYVPKISQDELWKGIIEEMFEEFLHFFFPTFVEEVDFGQPYEFLDKELQELIPDSETKNRKADLLVKVFLKNGGEKWLLVHIEVQGYEDSDFPLRMYTYHYRSFDRFNKKIAAIAILTDENPRFRPSHYEVQTWNTTVRYQFGVYKLLDYDEAVFEASNNPFASVMQVARNFIRNQTLKTDDDLLALKVKLFRKMYEKGHDKTIIRKMANFLKLYVSFKDRNYFAKFEQQLDNITNYQPSMGITELIKQRTIEAIQLESKIQGNMEGKIQGKLEGVEKMLLKGFAAETVADVLEVPLQQVFLVKQKIAIKAYFVQEQTVAQVIAHFDEIGEPCLFSTETLHHLHKQVAIQELLAKGETIETIQARFLLSDWEVKELQHYKK